MFAFLGPCNKGACPSGYAAAVDGERELRKDKMRHRDGVHCSSTAPRKDERVWSLRKGMAPGCFAVELFLCLDLCSVQRYRRCALGGWMFEWCTP